MRSISAGSQAATAQATAWRTMRSWSCSRSAEGTSVESHTPAMCLSGWSTTAAATTGPARQPRPTSSTPATYAKPRRLKAFSSVRIAGTRTWNPELLGALHPGGLALQVAQVIELRAPHLRRARDFDLLNRRRVQRKDALDALA